MTFLGIDIGTAAVKAVLIDEDDAILAEAAFAAATNYPESGQAEQDPEGWWAASLAAIDEIHAIDPDGFAALRAIGLTGQPNATVLLDAADAVIRPAMAWTDGRAAAEARLLDRQVPDLAEIAGGPANSWSTASRMQWLREYEPEAFARIAWVLPAKDFVRLRLTGERVTEASDGAGTMLLDARERVWSGSLVAAAGIKVNALPTLVEAAGWSGMVLPRLLADWQIDHPVVVAGGASAAAAAAVGIGAVRAGDGFVLADAEAQVCVARNAYVAPAERAHTVPHALPGWWYQASTPVNAMLCLDWLTGILGEADVGRLVERAQDGFAGPVSLRFVPYLAGEHPPVGDPAARGAFADLAGGGQREMIQAVLEGIALSLKDAIDGFGAAFPGGAIPLVGNGSRSALLLLIAASVLDRPLLRVANADIAAAFGAARLGRAAATGAAAESVAVQPPLLEVIDPLPELAEAYAAGSVDFRAFANSLRTAEPAAVTGGRRRRRA